MNRRDLLAASSAGAFFGVSGCIDRLDSRAENGADDSTDEGDDSGNGEESLSRELSVESIGDAPDEHGIELAVEVLTASMTGDEPPELEISLENVGERILARTGGLPLDIDFEDENAIYEEEPSGIFFLTESERERLEHDSTGCWSQTYVDRENPLGGVYYTPGESVTVRRTPILLESRVDEECPEPGSYPFVTSFSVHETDDLEKPEEEGVAYYAEGENVEVGFTLKVTE